MKFYNPFTKEFLSMLPNNIKSGIVSVKIQTGLINRIFNRWKTMYITYVDVNHGDSRNYGIYPVLHNVSWVVDDYFGGIEMGHHVDRTYNMRWKDKLRIDETEYILSYDNMDMINHDLNIMKTLQKVNGDCNTQE